MRLRRTVAAVGLAALASLTVAGSAGAAQVAGVPDAAACGQGKADKDHREYLKDFTHATNIRSGPSTRCTPVGVGYPPHSIDYHCWDYGENGTWSYLRTRGNVYGWVKDSELKGGLGSIVKC
ncbi:SH3 domain-containing protein [Actinosynnema sp. NPDC050436]|uniref:SH3 domain-containing protein n=1 Tax=Actinosynnema sp. NPDC050436 TaxID=3155659 RepID=UPI0033E0DAC1